MGADKEEYGNVCFEVSIKSQSGVVLVKEARTAAIAN